MTTFLFEEIVAKAHQEMAQKLEQEIHAALDAHAPDWTLDDVRWRCSLVSRGHGTTQVLKFDNIPLLEIYPIKTHVKPDLTKIIISYTREVRRLYKCAHVGR